MYSEQQLKDLTEYLRKVAQELIKKDTSTIDLGGVFNGVYTHLVSKYHY